MKKHIKMNVLVLGSGGREHTFVWKISQSKHCNNIFALPGNSGTSKFATNLAVELSDFNGIKKVVLENKIDMIIVGPEAPLVSGIHDFFLQDQELKSVAVIGPQKAAALLEGSKDFAKEFMFRHNIPTARYRTFSSSEIKEAFKFLDELSSPYVLKADGLAAGKGVLILDDIKNAKEELKNMLIDLKFGIASQKVVIEEFLDGIELSCFVVTDGLSHKILPTAKDYKRIGESDTGLNTGGMGAISPVPFVDDELMNKIEDKIIKPTMQGIKEDKLSYKGFIFIGLIIVDNEPKVIEYNVRMGDPEAEVVLPRLQTDFMELLLAIKNQSLNKINLKITSESAATVMLVSGGYPGEYEKGKVVKGLKSVGEAIVFHAGAKDQDGHVVTSGGRVMSVTALGKDHKGALANSYKAISKIVFEGMNYRRDIGFDL